MDGSLGDVGFRKQLIYMQLWNNGEIAMARPVLVSELLPLP
jgi:hypothetical protein